MTTLEYLQLTLKEKRNQSIDLGYCGIYIYGNKDNGKIRHWHDNGNLWSEWTIKNKLFNGEYRRWNSNGLLIAYTLYENNIKIKDFLKEN